MEKIQISKHVVLVKFNPDADIEESPHGLVVQEAMKGVMKNVAVVQFFETNDCCDVQVWLGFTPVKNDGVSEEPRTIRLCELKDVFLPLSGALYWNVAGHYAQMTGCPQPGETYFRWTFDEAKALAERLARALG